MNVVHSDPTLGPQGDPESVYSVYGMESVCASVYATLLGFCSFAKKLKFAAHM